MFSTTDTIVAIATPIGRGAIGVVRLSGPDAPSIAQSLLGRSRPLTPRHATHATLTAGTVRDRVVATAFASPRSYTGEEVVEISAHGSPAVLQAIVEAACDAGCRLAAPGEFTLRAYLNGKIDLAQAEAVADLIDAVTPLQARTAFDQLNGTLTTAVRRIEQTLFDLRSRLEASVDFPDEGYRFIEPAEVVMALEGAITSIDGLLSSAARGRLVREGLQVALVGKPNVGKSSLFNALVGARRAIVSPTPGTTRDLVTEVVDLRGLRVTLVDTAGVTESTDVVESEGVARALEAVQAADVVLMVCDGTAPFDEETYALAWTRRHVLVSSKADLPSVWSRDAAICVSSVDASGIDTLVQAIVREAGGESTVDAPSLSNVRHVRVLERARESLVSAAEALSAQAGAMAEEFVLADMDEATRALGELCGHRTSDELLAHVFSRFCVGK